MNFPFFFYFPQDKYNMKLDHSSVLFQNLNGNKGIVLYWIDNFADNKNGNFSIHFFS